MKTGNFFSWGLTGAKACTFWPKVKKMLFMMEHPTCTLNLVYISAGVFRDQKSLNRIKLS